MTFISQLLKAASDTAERSFAPRRHFNVYLKSSCIDILLFLKIEFVKLTDFFACAGNSDLVREVVENGHAGYPKIS